MRAFNQLYETGYSGWRWYKQFLDSYPDMLDYVKRDTWSCLVYDGVVCA